MDKEKIAKLVIDCSNPDTKYDGSGESVYDVSVNMGNYATNVDDVIFLQLEECGNIIAASSSDPPINIAGHLRIEIDVPQQDAVECFTDSNTYEVVCLTRDPNKVQTRQGALSTWNFDPAQWQVWSMQHKPARIAMRPEIFQQKHWRIRVVLGGSNVPAAPKFFKYMYPPLLVFSLSK